MINKEELTVNGYVFATPEDAELAKGEMKKIAYIESHTDMTNVEIVRSVYAKALESRAFQTPIGLEYMHTLWERVKNAGGENEPEPIPLLLKHPSAQYLEPSDGAMHVPLPCLA